MTASTRLAARAISAAISIAVLFQIAGCDKAPAPEPMDENGNGFHAAGTEKKALLTAFDAVASRYDVLEARINAMNVAVEYLPESVAYGRPPGAYTRRGKIVQDIAAAYRYQSRLFKQIDSMKEKPNEESLPSCHKLKHFMHDEPRDYSLFIDKLHGVVSNDPAMGTWHGIYRKKAFIDGALAFGGQHDDDTLRQNIQEFDDMVTMFEGDIAAYEARAKERLLELDRVTLELHGYRVQAASMYASCRLQAEKLGL